jgi:hypothetical protein
MNINESSMLSVNNHYPNNAAGCYICQNQDIQLELSQLLAPLLPRSCQVVVAKPCEVVFLAAEVVFFGLRWSCAAAVLPYGWWCPWLPLVVPTQLVDLMSCLVAARPVRPTCRVYPMIFSILID